MKTQKTIVIIFRSVLLGCIFFCGFISKAQDDIQFEKKVFKGKSSITLPYRFFKPVFYNDSSSKYPLVIFLHGAGERGNDNEKQLTNGVKNFVTSENKEKYPCYIVAPQCAEGFRWVETDWNLPSHQLPENPSVYLQLTKELIDSLCQYPFIDTSRIYITGLSMGGFGTWDAIMRWPGLFAAAIPVCGGADTSKADLIKKIPLWIFHGALDKVVLTSRSRDMVAALKKSGANPLYTEYPDLAHGIWAKTYSNPALFQWMFKQKKSD